MAKYSSKPVVVARSAEELAEKFSDFSTLGASLDNMTEEERAKVGKVEFSKDSITITTPQVGNIVLTVKERTPERVVLEAVGSPVPMKLEITFRPVDAQSAEVCGTIDVEIPAMLRPLIGGTMQKAADQFGALFARLA